MGFFNTISVAFCLWQYICFSPFSLESSKKSFISEKVRQIFSLTVISLQLLVMILCMVFVDQFVYRKRENSIKVVDTITMMLVQLTALVIFYESYVKRSIQRGFLQKINSIDFILEFKIGIILLYAKQKKNKRSTASLLVTVKLFNFYYKSCDLMHFISNTLPMVDYGVCVIFNLFIAMLSNHYLRRYYSYSIL